MSSKPKQKIVPNVDQMRDIFDDSQRVDKHNTCLKRLICLQTIHSKTNQLIKQFYKEFVRNVKFSLYVPDYRSPFGQNTIDFVIKYLLSFGSSADSTSIEDNDEQRHEFIDAVLEDVVIPYTNSKKMDCRINACHLIRLLADELDDINDDIYDLVRKALLDRSVDKIASVRAAAVLALHRFQDSNDSKDLVIQAIHFHLNYDPDPEVRHNCLKSMAASQSSLAHFVGATRDVKDFIRKTAYIQIADKLQIKCFTIEQRLTVLKNGLKDRSPTVRKVVESVLIPSWVKSCNNNLIELLVALDIQTDIELIEKMLEIYFKHLSHENVCEDSTKTRFHEFVDEFRTKYLTEERVLSVSTDVEIVFLWRFLSQFCKTNQIESKELKTTETTTELSEQTVNEIQTEDQLTTDENQNPNDMIGETVAPNVETFDLLVPDIPIFCAYLQNFVHNVITSKELSIADALDYEFIYNQLMKISLLLDIGDDAQRKILIKTMRAILIDQQIGDKFHKYITPVMKCLAKNGFKDNSSYLDFTAEMISEIFASIVSTSDENESMIDETNRELEDKRRDNLKESIDKCKTDLQDLETEGKTSEAEELTKQLKDLELELNGLKDNTLLQSLQSTQPKPLPSFAEHPKCLIRCLHIFSGCLEFGDYSEVNAVMQTHIEKVCLPGFLSDDMSVRCVATRCLGLVCLTSPLYFKKYLHFLIEIFMKDDQTIKLIALQSIFDSLCEHGINIFDEKVDKNGEKVRQLAFEDTEEDFITSLKQFFETQLESEMSEIKETAVQGVAKLLIHCRMYSPDLLSKLIIIWFTPDENQVLIQFIGDFLRMYAMAESQGVIIGQSAIEEAFVKTLEVIYENNLRNINSNHLIKYFLNLISEESHPKLAIDLAKKVLNIIDSDSTQTKLCEEYLLTAISHMSLLEMGDKELKILTEDMDKIVAKFADLKSNKAMNKLNKIMNNIKNRSQQMTADSAFMNDFAPIDDTEDNDNTIGDPMTVCRTASCDSEADSYRTCPESPQQKRRKTIESNSEIDIEINESIETNSAEITSNESQIVDKIADNIPNEENNI